MIDIVKRLFFCGACFFLTMTPLRAQEPKAEMSSVSYKSLPAHASLVLEAADTLLNQQVLDRLKVSLPKQGYQIETQGNYGLIVNAELITPDYREHPPQHWQLLDLKFPSKGPARKDYFISFAIYDKQTGLYVWRGEIARVDEAQSIDDIRDSMVDLLVNSIGKSVKSAVLP